ncbi:MAG: lactate utilization protein B [Paludibacteraceae bacterium]|nr:lactate utilization protein B [Paludibacteraceae bacterium]
MPTLKKKFVSDAKNIAFNERHREVIKFNISKYDAAVAKGFARYRNLAAAREQAGKIKREVLAHWSDYLCEFEQNITRRGVQVLWAKDTQEAIGYVQSILVEENAHLLVKSKSMTTEEIELNDHAKEMGCESVETDLGEFIVQVAGEKPYHIVTPAMHKSKEDIAKLFNEKFNTPVNSTPEELTAYVRGVLRKKFTTADVGVTGANFLIADIGGISVTENEGNGCMSMSFPKTHIVIAGIEKIIPKMEQLGLFYPLLAAHGTGQQMTVYNSIVTSPKQANETNGPQKMYVILLDNGRTNVYADAEARESLACIRCGACLNGCPVYKTIGGYTYAATYSGPIGSVITPFFKGFKDYGHLSFASSLCGKCAEGCPVRIPLTDILLANRRKMVEHHEHPCGEQAIMSGFRMITSKRVYLDFFPSCMKNMAVFPLNYFGWGNKRKMSKFAPYSFSKNYLKQQQKK